MAALDTSCFDGVIGLARCECPCRVDIAPDGYNDATSGLYVTDLVPFDSLETSADCSDPANPWNILTRAETEAKITVLKDITNGLMKSNQFTRPQWVGIIGEKVRRDVKAIGSTYAGARISSARIKGGYFRLTRIGGCFNANGTVSVQIYDRFNTAIGSPVVLNTVAGAHVSTACDITLPLWVDGANNPEYFAVYTVDQDNLPRDTRLFCSPCTKKAIPEFNTIVPYYHKKWNGAESWANWMMVGTVEVDNLTDFDLQADEVVSGSGLNGLTLHGELTCSPSASVCLDSLDYSDPVALSAAHALRYMAAIITAEKIIRSPEPHQQSVSSREILAVDVPQWMEDYQKQIEYIRYNANTSAADCIFCKPKYSMSIETKRP